MNRFFSFLVGLFLVFSNAGIAGAYSFDMGPDSTVDVSGTQNALELYATINPDLENMLFDLEEGQSQQFFFAKIGTTENWINADDTKTANVTANIDFEIPDLIQGVQGESIGFSAALHYFQGWNLTWDDPVYVDFGHMNSGRFSIELSDIAGLSDWWQGPSGSADVFARITLESAPVPEPGTMILFGLGLVGLAGATRKKFMK